MNLIQEIEIAYFRSFYKVRLLKCGDLNVIFGKNDAGKSNIIRALSLFFNNEPDHVSGFDFDVDFSESRKNDAVASQDIRKFIYVKVVFNTPINYQKSLGKSFYVKRQWTVSRDDEFHEEISNSIKPNQRHIVTRFLNKIRFIYIPAIKDLGIFEMLLRDIYQSVAGKEDFVSAVEAFTRNVQNTTSALFDSLPPEVASETKISAPTRLDELFQTLDFETVSHDGGSVRSLTTQRGDGIKARHIPELLKFISDNDGYDFHVWGFEEPENSLDFVAAESEASRFKNIADQKKIQVFLTTHSPAFYRLAGERVNKYYVRRDEDHSLILQGRDLQKFDPDTALGEGFYLPAIAERLEEFAHTQSQVAEYENSISELRKTIADLVSPMVLTEGVTDEIILKKAWSLRREGECPFRIQACDTSDDAAHSAGGATKLAICLKAVRADSPHPVIGIFDYDNEGIKSFKLDNNFRQRDLLSNLKFSNNRKAAALLLPVPANRTACGKRNNLPIEFLFSDDALNKRVEGKGLELEPMTVKQTVGQDTLEFPIEGGLEAKTIKESSKKNFVKYVVPTLESDDFKSFDALFDCWETALSELT